MEKMKDEIVLIGSILEELFQFDGSLEELCAMSEMEGEFHLSSNEMLNALHSFVEYSKTLS